MAIINGTSLDDTIRPTGNSSGVTGGVPTAGADTINGYGGNDTIDGGDGNDTIDGGDGNDTLRGSGGDDLAYGGNGSDILYGGTGNDTLYGNAGTDQVFGEAGNDILYGSAGDIMDGGADDDILIVPNLDVIAGNVRGGTGFDELRVTGGTIAGVTFNWFDSSLGIEAVTSNGNDALTITGAAGAGTVELANTLDFTGVFLFSGTAILGDTSNNMAVGGNDIITGSASDDIIQGMGGNYTLNGGAGDDIIYGGDRFASSATDGSDTIDGGLGDKDTAVYNEDISAANIVFTNSTSFTVTIGGVTDTLHRIQRVKFSNATLEISTGNLIGTPSADTLSGTVSNDIIVGYEGNDVINGLAGNDSLVGGLGLDNLNGGTGDDDLNGGEQADALNGGSGNDLALYINAASGVTVSLENPVLNTGEAAGDTLQLLHPQLQHGGCSYIKPGPV